MLGALATWLVVTGCGHGAVVSPQPTFPASDEQSTLPPGHYRRSAATAPPATPVSTPTAGPQTVMGKLQAVQQAVPFPIRIPRQADVQLEDVRIPALPGVTAHAMKEEHPDWRYVELRFSSDKGGGFLLNESNGGMGVSEGGETFTLVGRPATYVQGGWNLLLVDLGTLHFVVRSTSMSRAEMEEVAQNLVRDDGQPTIQVAELVTHYHGSDRTLRADVEQDRVLLAYLAQLVDDAERLDDAYLKPLSVGVPGGRNQLTITYADKRTSTIERAYRCHPDDPTACTGTAPDDIVVIDSRPAKSAQLAAFVSGEF